MKEIPIIQICGFQNSGKTTLVNKILCDLTKEGVQVVTIKHHGHGGKPDVMENKDSSSHINNGAIGSIVEGDGRLLMQIDGKMLSLTTQIKMAEAIQPDLIIIEGHKYESFSKIVLIRTEADLFLLEELSNICFVVVWDKELLSNCNFENKCHISESEKILIFIREGFCEVK